MVKLLCCGSSFERKLSGQSSHSERRDTEDRHNNVQMKFLRNSENDFVSSSGLCSSLGDEKQAFQEGTIAAKFQRLLGTSWTKNQKLTDWLDVH